MTSPSEAKEQAATDLTAAARDGGLSITIGETLPLERVAKRTILSTLGPGTVLLLPCPD